MTFLPTSAVLAQFEPTRSGAAIADGVVALNAAVGDHGDQFAGLGAIELMDTGQVSDVDLDLFDGEVGKIARLDAHRLRGGCRWDPRQRQGRPRRIQLKSQESCGAIDSVSLDSPPDVLSIVNSVLLTRPSLSGTTKLRDPGVPANDWGHLRGCGQSERQNISPRCDCDVLSSVNCVGHRGRLERMVGFKVP